MSEPTRYGPKQLTREELRAAWIEDLRTTDAPQGKGALIGEDGFCCLARACEVYGAPYDGSEQFAPVEIVDAFGLLSDEGMSQRRGASSLAELNDDGDLNFIEIAAAIETGEFWVENT